MTLRWLRFAVLPTIGPRACGSDSPQWIGSALCAPSTGCDVSRICDAGGDSVAMDPEATPKYALYRARETGSSIGECRELSSSSYQLGSRQLSGGAVVLKLSRCAIQACALVTLGTFASSDFASGKRPR